MILAIDPGNVESGFVYLDDNLKVIDKGKLDNEDLLNCIQSENFDVNTHIAIEMIASYGMAVGQSVFETCVWIGRFIQAFECHYNRKYKFIYRKEEKINLCGTMKAKDNNIRQALIDRFAKHDFKNGKGTKANPDVFYGFKSDIWAAMAVAVTYYDTCIKAKIQ